VTSAVAVLAVAIASGCTHSCDASATLPVVLVELPEGWTVTQLCVDTECVSSRMVEISGEPGARSYTVAVVCPDGTSTTFDGSLTTYRTNDSSSCGGPVLQGRITIRADGPVETS
jgi:hypothetical protein